MAEDIDLKNLIAQNKDKFEQSHKIKNIEIIASGGEGSLVCITYENGKKIAVKVFCGKISVKKGFNVVKEDSKKQAKVIEGTEKTVKIRDNGELFDGNNKFFYEVYNYMDFNLHSTIKNELLNDPLEKSIVLLRIVLGVCSLHGAGIAHRDLKLENIMLNEKDKITKLIDFGFSERLEDEKTDYKSKGTPNYAALEIFLFKDKLNKEMLLAADIYALGIIIYTVIYDNQFKIINKRDKILYLQGEIVERKSKEEIPKEEENFINFIAKMLDQNYEERPTATEVLKEITKIYIGLNKAYEENQESKSIDLKPREKIRIRMLTGIEDISVDEEEIKIIENKTLNKIKEIIEDKNTTDNLKQCIKNSINIILNDNIFEIENEKLGELSEEEASKLKKIENRLKEVVLAQNEYYLNEIKKSKNQKILNLKEI